MKKTLTLISVLCITVLFFSGTSALAQKKEKEESANQPAFSKGSNTIGFGVGLGTGYNFYGYTLGSGSGIYAIGTNSFSRMPSFIFIYDHGIIDNAGPGTIGIGGVFAINTTSYKYGNGDKDKYRNIAIGVRGTYHLTLLKDKNNKFDPYGGVTAGLRIFHYSENYSTYTENDVYPLFGLFVGAKYNFKPNFGVFSELGYDVSIFKIGLNFNF